MSVENKKKENTFKSKPSPKKENNDIVTELPVNKEETTSKKQKKTQKKDEIKEIDPRIWKICGFVIIAISLYLFLALVSYYISSFGEFFQPGSEELKNITGSIGGSLSQLLTKESFGVGAFYFVYLLVSLGLYPAFSIKIKWWTLWEYAMISLLWIPLFFATLPDNCAIFGGAVGQMLFDFLFQYIGMVGIVLILTCAFIIYAVFDLNIRFAFISKIFKHISERRERRKAEREAKREADDKEPEPEPYRSDTTDRPKNSFIDNNDYDGPENDNTEDDDADDEITLTVIEKEDVTDKPSTDAVESIELTVDTHESESTTPSSPTEVSFEVVEGSDKTDEVTLEVEQPIEEETTENSKNHFGLDTLFNPRLELNDYKFPELNLLRDFGDQKADVSTEELEANKNRIIETLGNYGIKIDRIKATIGPTVTLYEIVPSAGVRISKIKNLEDDIALSLSALGIRIIAPIPGKGTIGIEVPNKNAEIVSMKSVLSSEKFQNSKAQLPFAIGKTITNETFVVDLAKMPHILMAGATGQGKSVGLNAIINSLLYSKHPSELKFVLVDPKKVELTLYDRLERHYLAKLPNSDEAIITDVKKVILTLNSLCIEMDNRFMLLKAAQCRNIIEYNEKFKSRVLLPTEGHHFMPYIVLVIDEFADLIMTAGREVEVPIARLAQLARAIGIHLIIATQRPSVNIITGSIKANFPARIAFRVISAVDSKTILDQSGANQLIGRGDMLFSTGNDLVRLQCAFIDTPEVEAITEFIGSQRGYPEPFLLPEVDDDSDDNTNGDDYDNLELDSLFEEAARIVVETQQGSTSMIQRKLKLGYNRAGRIIDQLEAAGIVGPFVGSKMREVKVANLTALEQILKDLELKD